MEKWRKIKDVHKEQGLKKVLTEVMLWGAPSTNKVRIGVEGSITEVDVLAELPGAAFLQLQCPSPDATSWFRLVDKELAKLFPERLIRFQNPEGDSWYWPKKLASGSLSSERITTTHDVLPDFLAQRLAGLSFTQKEYSTPGAINPLSVKEKIRGQFETGKVTSDFYRKFKERHDSLTSKIVGLPSNEHAASYSTLLLNRLMFIYFLQKKEFLNGDPNYLTTCLRRIQALQGKETFYSFYKDYLLELFFNKLDSPSGVIHNSVIHEIAGDVPYVNGGVFSRSAVEIEFDIDVPDSAFEEIFGFFDSYTWHLDTRPTGAPNEINPEVIGYIFEQYINYTAEGKKENGAYYTKHDVTGFMVGQTLVPRILDEVVKLGVDPFALLADSPDNYIFESLKHGWDIEKSAWKAVPGDLQECWESDPIHWGTLDRAGHAAEFCLPDETWVEAFARRERVDNLRKRLSNHEVSEVNDIITLNLNSEKLLADAIASIEDQDVLESLWNAVSNLKVIDPTCGSGAFLFAALEILEVVYGNILDSLEEHRPNSIVLKAMEKHPNRRYFLRKHSALLNIFGTDIMADAIETAKLRIFLALASCLETRSELEPLPDLDFNLKVGNLVVGFVNAEDVSRVDDGRLIIENRLADIEESMSSHLELYKKFLTASSGSHEDERLVKSELSVSQERLRSAANAYYAECTNRDPDEFAEWAREALPFHWSIEFPAVFAHGGFDVVVGNPPYIKKAKLPPATRRSLVGFSTQDLPDFYAVCLERSDQIRARDSRKSMIVMLSLAFSPAFEKIRKTIFSTNTGALWLSTFGKRPDSLFQGVQVRNSIVSQGPGNVQVGTSHNIFGTARRRWLFEGLAFTPLAITNHLIPIRAGEATALASAFPSDFSASRAGTSRCLYLRPTGQYWLPALPGRPPVFEGDGLKVAQGQDTNVNAISLALHEDPRAVLCLLAGKLGYLWWSSVGDDFHTFVQQTLPPRGFMAKTPITPELDRIANAVLNMATNHVFGSKNAGKVYVNIRWTDVSMELDNFARELLAELQMLDHWRPLNIWYRRTMRSGGENNNSVLIPQEVASSLFSGIESRP